MTDALSKIPTNRRRLLLVGTNADRARLRLDQETRNLLINRSLHFVNLEEAADSDDPIVRALAYKDLLQAGTLLIQSPSAPDQYTRLSEVSDQTAESKLSITVRVCQLLGARRVEIRHAEFRATENTARRTGTAQSPGIAKGSVDATSSTIEVGGLRVRSVWLFRGGTPQLEDASMALVGSGLRDESLQGMIDFFRTPNWPVSHEFEISTTEEMRRILDIVGDLSIPAAFKAHTELESFKASEKSYRFQLWVEFPEGA
jgi:hypothetical protein